MEKLIRKEKVTLWYMYEIKKDKDGNKTGEYKFNHLETGLSRINFPQALKDKDGKEYLMQRGWKYAKWERQYAILRDGVVTSHQPKVRTES
jgi:hypothetical protein